MPLNVLCEFLWEEHSIKTIQIFFNCNLNLCWLCYAIPFFVFKENYTFRLPVLGKKTLLYVSLERWMKSESVERIHASQRSRSLQFFNRRPPSIFVFPKLNFLPCSSLLVCLDGCDDAKRQASDQCQPPRHIFTSVSTHAITAQSREQEPGLYFPGVSHVVVVHLLSLCECEGCSPLCQTHSSSTYPSVEHQWQDEWVCMRLGIGGVLLG